MKDPDLGTPPADRGRAAAPATVGAAHEVPFANVASHSILLSTRASPASTNAGPTRSGLMRPSPVGPRLEK